MRNLCVNMNMKNLTGTSCPDKWGGGVKGFPSKVPVYQFFF